MNNTRKSRDELIEDLDAARRELEIEKALDRVRARALGMQESREISDVTAALFEAFRTLGFGQLRSGVMVLHEDEDEVEVWLSRAKGEVQPGGRVSADFKSQWARDGLDAIRKGDRRLVRALQKEEARSILEGLQVDTGDFGLDMGFKEGETLPDRLYVHWFIFSNGCLYLTCLEPLSEENCQAGDRFAEAFGFAYARMQEIAKAEQQARQAERRSGVDHIRAEIAAMRTTEDFERVTPLLWQTLKVLGVSFHRCGVTINDRETERSSSYLSDPEGNPIASMDMPVDIHPSMRASYDAWMRGEAYVQRFTRDAFMSLAAVLQKGLRTLQAEHFVDPEAIPENMVIQTVPFSHGTLYINSEALLSRDDLSFVEDLAGAFSVAYARYQDFRQLEKQNEELEVASQLKSRFLATMSHELRTPMNAIIGFTRLVQTRAKQHLPERHQENLEKVRLSAEHLLALINDILDLSKIEANRMDIRVSDFDMDDLVAMCCATVSPLVKPGVVFDYEQGAKVGGAHTDQDRLRQVLINLLSNALKFTETGSVTVRAKCVGETLLIRVADTGIGIPSDKLEMIFDEFSQVDNSATRKYQGTGLGLSICRKLTELMGGTIIAESNEGKGSAFTIQLPMIYREA